MIGNVAQRFPRAQVVQVVQRAEVKPKPSRIDVKQQAVKAEVKARPVAVRVQIGGLQGEQGIPGTPGSGGDSVVVQKFASGSVGGHRIVRSVDGTRVEHADSADLSNIDDVLGLSNNAASDGGAVNVTVEGEITEAGWSWTPLETLFLGADGLMTQEEPESPAIFSLPVGYATSPTSMRVRIGVPIEL